MNTKILSSTSRVGLKTTLCLAAGCLLGMGTAQMANADSMNDVPTLVVKYDAHSLDTDNGARALYQRLESAARKVCPDESNRDLTSLAAVRECREASVARAVRQINDPRLANIYQTSDKRG